MFLINLISLKIVNKDGKICLKLVIKLTLINQKIKSKNKNKLLNNYKYKYNKIKNNLIKFMKKN